MLQVKVEFAAAVLLLTYLRRCYSTPRRLRGLYFKSTWEHHGRLLSAFVPRSDDCTPLSSRRSSAGWLQQVCFCAFRCGNCSCCCVDCEAGGMWPRSTQEGPDIGAFRAPARCTTFGGLDATCVRRVVATTTRSACSSTRRKRSIGNGRGRIIWEVWWIHCRRDGAGQKHMASVRFKAT